MTIRLKPDQERAIRQAIEAGLIKTPDDVVELGIETIQRRLEAQGLSSTLMSAQEWLQDFHTWIHSHPTTTPLLSDEAISRDSIYGTRGQ